MVELSGLVELSPPSRKRTYRLSSPQCGRGVRGEGNCTQVEGGPGVPPKLDPIRYCCVTPNCQNKKLISSVNSSILFPTGVEPRE